MNLKQTRLHILHKPKDLSGEAKTGVSLHCHTEHSKEMLDFLPHYAAQIPVIAYFYRKENDKYKAREGKDIDLSTGYWSPPLTAQEVFDIEKKQINETGLDAIASISDHDGIDANLQINEKTKNEQAPISLEWTVPFEFGFFHLGVHNLPKERAVELVKTLLDYTYTKENHNTVKLDEMFSMLNQLPEVLVVLNHPLWDIEMVGKERHAFLLKNFLREHGRWIHALEINGFRKWSENKAVIEMAEALGLPVVTGGDRHGCKPNTVINLTSAKTFAEFTEEVRVDKRTSVVLMPEYKEPLQSRQLESFAEILKFYPNFPEGRKRWFDRVHFDVGDGHGTRKLSVHWDFGGPTWLQWATRTLGFLGHERLRPVFRLTRKKRDRVPKSLTQTEFTIPDAEDELTINLANSANADSAI
ncbi:MAG: hypothetical protein H0U87_10820 [Acidobacteria bacterium]|jgi:hypothetical protein|nr:hypothetical protein [Acidobacteriota bacterium]